MQISFIDMWVEHELLLKASKCFRVAGKYRTDNGDAELDIVYSDKSVFFDDIFAIEVKNRPAVPYQYIDKYLHMRISPKELFITDSDVLYKSGKSSNKSMFVGRLRNDIAVLLMEFGFIRHQYDNYSSTFTLLDLCNMYNISGLASSKEA